MRATRFLLGALAILLMSLPMRLGQTHDHREPRATAWVGNESQAGWIVHSSWTRAADRPGLCTTGGMHGSGAFPRRAIRYEWMSDVPTVRLHKPDPPVGWLAHAWTEVTKKGRPRGEPQEVRAALVPRIVDGKVTGWEVRLPQLAEGHWYLRLEVSWRDEDGCMPQPDMGSQYMIWAFHIRAMSRSNS